MLGKSEDRRKRKKGKRGGRNVLRRRVKIEKAYQGRGYLFGLLTFRLMCQGSTRGGVYVNCV